MVRTYKRKSTQGSYGSEQLALAVAAIREGQSIRSAGIDFGISRRTLKRHCVGAVRSPGEVAMGSKRCLFSGPFEEQLVDYAKEMAERMYGLTTIDVRRLAFAVAEKLGLPHVFDKERGLAGKDWLKNFMRRNPTLSIRTPIATSIARLEGFNRGAVMEFFGLFKGILQARQYGPTRIWNCDETGFTTVSKPGKVVCMTGARQVRKVSSSERGKNITALCCMSAAGAFIPPLFVFPRKRMPDALMNGSPAGALGVVNDRGSGYIDSITFMTWLKHFATIAGCSKDDQHILLLDGHESHKTLEAIDFTREHGIVLLTFPPHCTHRLQPLDRTYFKSLKSAYSRSCDNWMTTNRGRPITQYEVMPLFAQAYSSTASIESAVNGFAVSGLWLFDDTKFDAKFGVLEQPMLQPVCQVATTQVASTATTRPQVADIEVHTTPARRTPAALEIAANEAAVPSVIATHVASTATTRPQVADIEVHTTPARRTPVALEIAANEAVVPSVIAPHVAGNDVDFHQVTTTSPNHLASPISSDIRGIIVQCSPPPPMQKKANNRKKTKSVVLTSSPYKKLAEERRQNRKSKKFPVANKVTKRNPPKTAPQPRAGSSGLQKPIKASTIDNTECLVCCEPYANSKSRETWVQCWAAGTGLTTLARQKTHTTYVTIATRTLTNRANAEGHWWRVS